MENSVLNPDLIISSNERVEIGELVLISKDSKHDNANFDCGCDELSGCCDDVCSCDTD